MSADFEITLTDGVSAPAEGMLSKIGDLDSSLGKVSGSSSGAGSALQSIGEGATQGAGGLDTLADGFMQSAAGEAMLDALDPVTLLMGIATAAVAAAGALVALVAAGMKESLEASELKEHLMGVFTGLTGSAQGAQALISQLDALRAETGLTRAQLAPMAQTLVGLGFSGQALTDQLKAMAAADAMVAGGSDKLLTIMKSVSQHLPVQAKSFKDLADMGITVADMAKAMGMSQAKLTAELKKGTINAQQFNAALATLATQKGAAALEAQSLSLTNQWARLQELITQLFEDVDTSGFMKGLKSVIDLFDQSTASGKALKAGITAAFNAIFKVASMVWPWIKKAIELVIIAALKIYIAFKPVIKTFQDLFKAGGPNVDWLFFFKLALGGIVDIATGVANGIMMVVHAVQWIIAAFKSGEEAAKNLVQGLVNGITNGTGMVVDAIKHLGSSAMSALKGLLGISSPSKEFAKLGQHVGAGFALGLDGSHVAVANASQRMGTAAAAPAVQAAKPLKGSNDNAKGAGGKSGGVTVNFQPGSVVVQGASAQSAQELSEHTLSLAFERVKLVLGAS